MWRSLVARYIDLGPTAPAGGSLGPPMGGSLTAGELAIYGADLNYHRLPIKLLCLRLFDLAMVFWACPSIWRLLQLTQCRKQPLSSTQRSSINVCTGGLSDPGRGRQMPR
ncbi:conserved hypothetical protein [Trichinella spiralis]|uniref:hypothetical protein n=1 Tax=Trichinella spiralis TaxID=6334 RepID=UPI0001EFE034|nr:conserved hypothetical protein [Trichinella spiralis]